MIAIDPDSPVPINDQIKAGLKGLVSNGVLKAGDKAPSVRGLASRLKVNPNTVARSFRELALEGFFETRRGEGNFISQKAGSLARDGLAGARQSLEEAVRLARRTGLSFPEIEEIVREARNREGED